MLSFAIVCCFDSINFIVLFAYALNDKYSFCVVTLIYHDICSFLSTISISILIPINQFRKVFIIASGKAKVILFCHCVLFVARQVFFAEFTRQPLSNPRNTFNCLIIVNVFVSFIFFISCDRYICISNENTTDIWCNKPFRIQFYTWHLCCQNHIHITFGKSLFIIPNSLLYNRQSEHQSHKSLDVLIEIDVAVSFGFYAVLSFQWFDSNVQ